MPGARFGLLGSACAWVALACSATPSTRLLLVRACPAESATTTLAESATTTLAERAVAQVSPPIVHVAASAERTDSVCREVRYDSAAGPRLFYAVETEEGAVTFESELPFSPGERFVTVRDEEYDAPPQDLPLEVVVADVTKDGASYRISARFAPGLLPPSRLVGPLEAGDHHLVGKQGEGSHVARAEVGQPQLLYQVWLQQGVLEEVVVRCSRTVFVDQLWLVSDRRTCIRSSFERIEGNLL